MNLIPGGNKSLGVRKSFWCKNQPNQTRGAASVAVGPRVIKWAAGAYLKYKLKLDSNENEKKAFEFSNPIAIHL